MSIKSVWDMSEDRIRQYNYNLDALDEEEELILFLKSRFIKGKVSEIINSGSESFSTWIPQKINNSLLNTNITKNKTKV